MVAALGHVLRLDFEVSVYPVYYSTDRRDYERGNDLNVLLLTSWMASGGRIRRWLELWVRRTRGRGIGRRRGTRG
jgi:hypothetical protein